MRLAYKGFNKDLTCTMGNGTFQYKPGVWYKEEKAHCARTGFHATDNPLDVLGYYREVTLLHRSFERECGRGWS